MVDQDSLSQTCKFHFQAFEFPTIVLNKHNTCNTTIECSLSSNQSILPFHVPIFKATPGVNSVGGSVPEKPEVCVLPLCPEHVKIVQVLFFLNT